MNQEQLTRDVRRYYDGQQIDRNLVLGEDTGIINHHFGIGDYDRVLFDRSQQQITKKLNLLELNQIDALTLFMGDVCSDHKVLDAGCGRGGTTFNLINRFGVSVDGITISPYQYKFAVELAKVKGLNGQARFHLMNYLDMSFDYGIFDHVITNETTQYTYDLYELFTGFAKVLKPHGRYTIATWCLHPDFADSIWSKAINKNYGTTMHTIDSYVHNLEKAGFTNIIKTDFTEMALPYWQLRDDWAEKSGVERPFISGHKSGEVLYYFLTAINGA